jgi:hypothetical protein
MRRFNLRLDYEVLRGLAVRRGLSSAGNIYVRDYEIRQGESGEGNRPEDQEIFHGQWVAHDQFEWGEIAKGQNPPDALEGQRAWMVRK